MRPLSFAPIVALLVASACTPAPLDAIAIDPTTLTDGLVAHWTFDEGTGTAVIDHSGNKHDGILTGGTWIAKGQFGGALHFDEGNFVTVDDFPNATEDWSVAAWVRLTDATQSTEQYKAVMSTESLGGWEMNIDRSMTQPGAHFGYWEGPVIADYYRVTCPCMQFGEWTHIVAVVDSTDGTLFLYVNGTLGKSLPITMPILAGSSPTLYMGKWAADGRLLVGDVDDVLIYARALFPAEVTELSKASPPDMQ